MCPVKARDVSAIFTPTERESHPVSCKYADSWVFDLCSKDENMAVAPAGGADKREPSNFPSYDSDCDSLMPYGDVKYHDDPSVATTELLSLCSGSTISHTSDGDSCSSAGPWNFQLAMDDEISTSSERSWSMSTVGADDDDSTVISLASQETLKVEMPTITTPSQDIMDAVRDTTIGKKAVRADDAAVPVTLWDMRIAGSQPEVARTKAFTGFRSFGRRLFHRAIYLDCMEQVAAEFGSDWFARDLQRVDDKGKWTKLGWMLSGIRNLMWHVDNTNFFEYSSGSKTYYFRYPIFYKKMVRDGCPIHFEKPGPRLSKSDLKHTQSPFPDASVREEMRKKVSKVRRRRYIVSTTIENILSIIRYFAVPKGEEDVRIVYDATASGLNECVWAPSFWLPTVDSLLRALDSDSWMADRDIGDMFLNFELHHSAWPYVGIDLAPVLENSDSEPDLDLVRWFHWVRLLMGFRPSPYCAIKTSLVAEEVIRGDRFDDKNPYQWERVVLNLPGPGYNPTKAWVTKVRKDSAVASDLFTFVDDERITGATEELTWQAGHALGAKQSYLGIQDAARKVGPCSQSPRAWAGAVVHVVPNKGVCVLTSEEKWNKLKVIVEKWSERILAGDEQLNHKELLSDRGFLVYVTRSYPGMVPYLKGFHLTIEMWRGNRDSDGWKLPVSQLSQERDNHLGPLDDEEAELAYLMRKKTEATLRAPKTGTTPVAPRLLHDLSALKDLSSSALPPLRIVRPSRVIQVVYGFGDASGKGFGSTVQGFPVGSLTPTLADNPVNWRVGIWGPDVESESSNYRELANLVLTVEEEAAAGNLDMAEFFLFTDNSTAESAFYKGSSSSKKLHALVLRLRKVELRHGMTLHVIHVSGKRMIAQGTDGCSRGVLLEGVMVGQDMLSFVDLAKSAVERCPHLLPWIQSWCPQSSITPLSPEGWYERGHGVTGGSKDKRGVWIPSHEPAGQTHLWTPPPAAADAALEELLKARHKRTDTTHIVVIPRLFTPRWRRLFHKVVDVSFTVAPGPDYWPTDMFEPLWIGIVLPFYRHSPWQLGRAPLMVELGRKLHRLCSEGEAAGGHLLRKLCKLPRRLASVPDGVARAVLRMPRK